MGLGAMNPVLVLAVIVVSMGRFPVRVSVIGDMVMVAMVRIVIIAIGATKEEG